MEGFHYDGDAVMVKDLDHIRADYRGRPGRIVRWACQPPNAYVVNVDGREIVLFAEEIIGA